MIVLAVLFSFRSLPSTQCGWSHSYLSVDPNFLSMIYRKKLRSLPSSLMLTILLSSVILNDLPHRREDLSCLNYSFVFLSWSKQYPWISVISLWVSEKQSLSGLIASYFLARHGMIFCTAITFFVIARINFFEVLIISLVLLSILGKISATKARDCRKWSFSMLATLLSLQPKMISI